MLGRRQVLTLAATLSLAPWLVGATGADASVSHGPQGSPATIELRGAPGLQVLAAGAEITWSIAQVTPTHEVVDLSISPHEGQADNAPEVTLRLPLQDGELLAGTGERAGPLQLRGQRLSTGVAVPTDADPTASHSPVPVIYTSANRALLVDSRAPAAWDLAATDPGAVSVALATRALRVHVFTGSSVADLVQQAAAAVIGLPPAIPAWGLGVWKTLVGGDARVQADLDALLAAGAPTDAVWMYDLLDETSGFGWPWPVHDAIPAGTYPDPAATVARLHQRGLKALGYLNPFVYTGSPAWAEAEARGLLVADCEECAIVQPWAKPRSHPDFTNPAAATWFAERVRAAVGDLGLDGAMADYGEHAPRDGTYTSAQPVEEVCNEYPALYLAAVHDGARSAAPNETVFLARSGALGSTASTTGRFTGDQERSWDPERGIGGALRSMLSGSLCGWPYWGPDIGGYLDPARPVENERELWVRWVQLGALSPLMRDHLGNMRARPTGALTDDETLATWRAYARLHRALEPTLVELAAVAQRTGLPIVRPMLLEHPDEPQAWPIDDQYLLGRDVLVAPVITSGQRRRRVYLPTGRWEHYWSGQTSPGRTWITVDAPLGEVPLFTRAGAGPTLPPPGSLWDTVETSPPPA